MRAVAARAIARLIGSTGRPDDAERIGATGALDAIRALLSDKDPRVRMAAEYAAARFGEEVRLEELLSLAGSICTATLNKILLKPIHCRFNRHQ